MEKIKMELIQGGKKPEQSVWELAAAALDRNAAYISEQLADLNEKIEKQEEKIADFTDEKRRAQKVEKLREKLALLTEERDILENLGGFTDSVKRRVESVQLELPMIEAK